MIPTAGTVCTALVLGQPGRHSNVKKQIQEDILMEMQNDYMNLRVGAGKFFYGHGCIRELATEVKRLGGASPCCSAAPVLSNASWN